MKITSFDGTMFNSKLVFYRHQAIENLVTAKSAKSKVILVKKVGPKTK